MNSDDDDDELRPILTIRILSPPLPLSRTKTPADATEKRLVTEVYDFARSIAELQLTESELALYSALVLLQPGE